MLRRRLLRERFLFTQAAPASAIFILIVPRPPITHALNRSQLHKNASLPTNTARWSALMREPNQIISYDLCSRPTDSLGKRPCAPVPKQLLVWWCCARSAERRGKKWFSMEEKWCLLLTYGADEFLFFHPRCGKQPKEGFLWSLERFSSQLHRAFLVRRGEKCFLGDLNARAIKQFTQRNIITYYFDFDLTAFQYISLMAHITLTKISNILTISSLFLHIALLV